MIATRARLSTFLWRGFIEQPTAWAVLALFFFSYVSRIPINGWNVEILIARNLLRGHGFVVGPLDPPALWRPPLAALALLPIEVLFDDPKIIFRIFATLCLTATMVALFYLMKRIGGIAAAHFSQLFAFTLPGLNMMLNRQFTMLSYLIMFATVFAALLVTVSAWTKPSRKGDALVGVAWGLAFLSRPESILFFGVTFVCSILVYLRKRTPRDVGQGVFVQAACFLLMYVPASATYGYLQAKHRLIGQEALVTYYAGEYFASNTRAVDPDDQGYAESVRRFGDPAVYQHSLIRFAVAQPRAVVARVTQNIDNTIELFSAPTLRFFDWIVFVVFGAMLALSTPPPVPGRYLLLYGTLLTVASTYFLLFHIDPRYPLQFVLMLFFTVQIAAGLVWQRVAGRWRHKRAMQLFIAACTGVVLLLFVVRVNAAVKAAKDVEIDIAPFRALAERFRAEVGPEGTPALGYVPLDSDAMWISYFANTSIPWPGNGGIFPRDRIYSFTNRPAEYMLVPGSTNLRDLGNPSVLWVDTFPRIGNYVCVDVRSRNASRN